MELQIENLKALIKEIELTPYQRALALTEWNNLLGYVKDLEQLNTPLVSKCEGIQREALLLAYGKFLSEECTLISLDMENHKPYIRKFLSQQ